MLAIFAEHEFQTKAGSVRLSGMVRRGAAAVVFLIIAMAGVQGKDAHPTFDVKVTGQGPAVLLIPGLSCSGVIWEETVRHLQDHYECHVLSLKGFGGVPPAKPRPEALLPQVRDEIIAYARSLGHPAIVGHSLGGVLAMDVAATAPDLPRCLVIVDSSPALAGGLGAGDQPEAIAATAAALRQRMEAMSAEDFGNVQGMAIRTMVNSLEQADVLTELANRSDQATVAQALSELIRTDLRPALARITCPALVVLAGINSSALSEEAQQKMRGQYSGLAGARVLYFEKARHFIMYDEPERFYEVLDGALGGS